MTGKKKRSREESADVANRTLNPDLHQDSSFNTGMLNISSHSDPKDATYAVEHLHLKEDFSNQCGNIDFWSLIEALFLDKDRGHIDAVDAFDKITEHQWEQLRVHMSDYRKTPHIEKTLYPPFQSLTNLLYEFNDMPFRIIDAHDSKVGVDNPSIGDPFRKPDLLMTIPSETFNNPMVPNPRIFWSEVLIPVEFKKSKKSEKHGEDTELCEDPPMKSVQNYLDPRLKAITVEDMSFSGSSLTRTRNHSRERLRHSFFSSTQASKTPFRLADVLRKEGTPERPLNHGFSYATSMHSASASYSTGKTLSDRAQLAGYAVEVFSASGLRRHVLGLFIEGTNFELWYFNRSGSYGSTPIPFGENFRNLIMFLLILGNASPAELGFEPFIHPPSTSDVTNSTRKLKRGEKEGFLRSADRAYFVIKGKTYVIRGERINRGRSIKGRGTMVWAVEEVKQHKAVTVVGGMVVKLSWQLSRRRSEVELLRFIREKGVTNVPEVFNHDDLDSLAAGAHGRVQPLVKEEQRRAADFDNRILRAIVLGPRLRPITSIPFGDFRAAYRDLVDIHHEVYTKSRLLHRDIHPENLMVQEVFSDGKGQYKAYLIDFDFAIEAGAREPGFSPTHRTVITPFLALELTTESEHRPRALYRHDLESFFWTYWWIAIYYGGDFRRPLKRRRLSSSRRKDDFVDWYVGTFGAIRRRKAAFLDDPYSIHLSPGMESLHPNIQKLRELFNDANDCLRRQRRNPRPDFDQETIDGLITYEGIRALL